MMKTAQEVLDFISKYAELHLAEAEKESNPTKSIEKYSQYDGIRELINAVIDEMDNKK